MKTLPIAETFYHRNVNEGRRLIHDGLICLFDLLDKHEFDRHDGWALVSIQACDVCAGQKLLQ